MESADYRPRPLPPADPTDSASDDGGDLDYTLYTRKENSRSTKTITHNRGSSPRRYAPTPDRFPPESMIDLSGIGQQEADHIVNADARSFYDRVTAALS